MDTTVGSQSNFYMFFPRLFLGVATESLLGDEELCSAKLE
jgi:hypothetical protein